MLYNLSRNCLAVNTNIIPMKVAFHVYWWQPSMPKMPVDRMSSQSGSRTEYGYLPAAPPAVVLDIKLSHCDSDERRVGN